MTETQRALRGPIVAAGETSVAARIVAAQGPNIVELTPRIEGEANFVQVVDIIRHHRSVAFKEIAELPVEQLQELDEFVLSELNDQRWDWRTMAGLRRSTDLPEELILSVIDRNLDRVERVHSKRYGLLFRPTSRRPTSPGSFLAILDRILDYLSFGKRSRLRP